MERRGPHAVPYSCQAPPTSSAPPPSPLLPPSLLPTAENNTRDTMQPCFASCDSKVFPSAGTKLKKSEKLRRSVRSHWFVLDPTSQSKIVRRTPFTKGHTMNSKCCGGLWAHTFSRRSQLLYGPPGHLSQIEPATAL